MKPKIERRSPWNIGTHQERMTARRHQQRNRVPTWALILLSAFGYPSVPNTDFFKEY